MRERLKKLWVRLRFRLIDWGLLARRGIFYIGGSDTLPPPLERAEEAELIARKTAPQKSEVSFDEPLNTDWDGNELLLSDILGTDEDMVMKPIEDDVDRQLLMDAVGRLNAREKEIITLRFGLGGGEEKTQKEEILKMS